MAGCCTEVEFTADVMCALLQQLTASVDGIYDGSNLVAINAGECSVRQAVPSSFVDNLDGSFTHTGGDGTETTIAVCDLLRFIDEDVAIAGDLYVTIDNNGGCKLAPALAETAVVTPAGAAYPTDPAGAAIVGVRYVDGTTPVFDGDEWVLCNPIGTDHAFACGPTLGMPVYCGPDGLRTNPDHTSINIGRLGVGGQDATTAPGATRNTNSTVNTVATNPSTCRSMTLMSVERFGVAGSAAGNGTIIIGYNADPSLSFTGLFGGNTLGRWQAGDGVSGGITQHDDSVIGPGVAYAISTSVRIIGDTAGFNGVSSHSYSLIGVTR